MTTKEPFDIDKEAIKVFGNTSLRKDQKEAWEMIVRIEAFGRRCADNALDRAVEAYQPYIDDVYSDISPEEIKRIILSLKSSTAGGGKCKEH